MLEIRDMTFDDIDEVVAIEKENFSTPWDENGFFSFMIRQGTAFICAVEDGHIVGYGGMVTAADEGDITNVSVSQHKRQGGVGTALVSRLLEKGTQMGIKKLFLEVRVSNDAAIHLYEKLGFTAISKRKDYYRAPIEDASVMIKEL